MKFPNHLWTFQYPNGDKAQIDYIIFRKKWRNSLHGPTSYSSFSSVSFDNHIVFSKMKLKTSSTKKNRLESNFS